jgi:hypothetical protein
MSINNEHRKAGYAALKCLRRKRKRRRRRREEE